MPGACGTAGLRENRGMGTPSDYRELLRGEFERRREKNPRYSLRAFARDLKLGPEWLSRIFSGQDGLSRARAQDLCGRLGFDTETTRLFCDMVEARHGRGAETRRIAQARVEASLSQRTRAVSLEAFAVIRDWYHLAILQLVETKGFRAEPAWIAKRLRIDVRDAADAMERLQKLDLLRRDADGTWTAPKEFLAGPDGVPSDAVRAFHREILSRALRALDGEGIETRSVSTAMLPFDRRQMPQARALIREFRRGFEKKLPPSDTKDAVYALSVQFVRLDAAEEP